MAKKKVGELIKEARTKAGMTQAELAACIKGLSASDISKAERGEKELTQEQLKTIAKITGVTQKSLLEAASSSGSSSKPKTSSTGGTSIKVTATEKKVIELYRAADSDTKKAAVALLKGEKSQLSGILSSILNNSSIMNTVSGLFGK